MLVSESNQYGGTWVFYVIAPIILLGSIACLWWIVKGATGVFGPGAAVGSQKASPLKAVRSAAPFREAGGISTMPAEQRSNLNRKTLDTLFKTSRRRGFQVVKQSGVYGRQTEVAG
jgi:hypothetical protein